MRSTIAVTAAIAVLAFTNSRADSPDAQQAVNDISHEYVSCYAYFKLVEAALREVSEDATADSYAVSAESALAYAVLLAESSRSPEMAGKVTAARAQLELDAMIKEIEGDFSNMSILMIKHSDACVEMIDDPLTYLEKRLDE